MTFWILSLIMLSIIILFVLYYNRRCPFCKSIKKCFPIKDYSWDGSYTCFCYVHEKCIENALSNPEKLNPKLLYKTEQITKILSYNEHLRESVLKMIKEAHREIDWDSMRSGEKIVERLLKKKNK